MSIKVFELECIVCVIFAPFFERYALFTPQKKAVGMSEFDRFLGQG